MNFERALYLLLASILLTTSPAVCEISRCQELFANSSHHSLTNGYFHWLNGQDENSTDLIAKYQSHQQDYFNQRLPKFKDQSNSDRVLTYLREISYRLRSYYLIATAEAYSPTQVPQFLGGVRVVFSKSPQERLPFEDDKVLGVRRIADSTDKISVEVGRLTGSMKLVTKIVEALVQYDNLGWVYVHTSTAHSRLYRMAGFTADQQFEVNDQNQILVFSRQTLIRQLSAIHNNSQL